MIKLKYFIFPLLFLTFSSNLFALCDFKTGDYIKKINKPDQISLIKIKIADSKKYTMNFLNIITSSNEDIPQDLKKKFDAKLTVKYKFGECNYSAKVRQHGDQRDHLEFGSSGSILRSLDVRLLNGNIAGAVRFKLLLPKTRNGPNEILATLILKNLGIISPETFEVHTEINNSKSIMIFQEKASKELLERNFYREGPIFEGDEELIWDYGDHETGSLTPLSLSRMVNDNWFSKGLSSQNISMNAFSKLQSSYLSYSMNIKDRHSLILYPNNYDDKLFEHFHLYILAMNGHHALNPFNRKFYFDSFIGRFRPIYYDGNVKFIDINNYLPNSMWEKLLSKIFVSQIDESFLKEIEFSLSSIEIENSFYQRIKSDDLSDNYFNESINIYINNIKKIIKIRNNIKHKNLKSKSENEYLEKYIYFQKSKKVTQNLIHKISRKDNAFNANFINNDNILLSYDDVRKIISKNEYKGVRTVLIEQDNNLKNINSFERKIEGFLGKIYSNGVNISTNLNKKVIEFKQHKSDDWVLIDSANLENWKIIFSGVPHKKSSKQKIYQRFNDYNLTGCLTINNSNLNNVLLDINYGGCEDSLNINKSSGSIDTIFIRNSFADAIDMDFSDININYVEINNAGNDCIDVSGGDYFINIVNINSCFDKGLSVGENSNFETNIIDISNSDIGISSKDLSKVVIKSYNAKNLNYCAEVMQKKQEFGGAYMKINSNNCSGSTNVDTNSSFLVINNEF